MELEQLPIEPDWSKYPVDLWGLAGMDPQRITYCRHERALRTRIGHRGIGKAGLCRLPGGDFLVSPCYSDEKGVMRMLLFRSSDEGRSWQQVNAGGSSLLGKEPTLVCLSDGTVLSVSDHPHGFRVSRSEDEGATWTVTTLGREFIDEEPHWEPNYHSARTVLEQQDESLILFVTIPEPMTGTGCSELWLFRSTDRGRSWEKHRRAQSWNLPAYLFCETSVLPLEDGRLLAASRLNGSPPLDGPLPSGPTPHRGGEADEFMGLMESRDGGITWSTPRVITNYAEVHSHLIHLRDGRILNTYASYHLPHGVWATLSDDGGRSFDLAHPVHLAHSLNPYTGWPTSVELPDGEILTVYATTAYLEGEGVSLTRPGKGDGVAEAVRWRVPPRQG